MRKLYTLIILTFGFYYSSAQAPVAGIKFTGDTVSCEFLLDTFVDNSTGNPTLWQWTFAGGNPSSSTKQNPGMVVWISAGVYSAKLVVSNANGSDSTTLFNYFTIHPSPPAPALTFSHDTLFCSYDTSYISYQWHDNGTPIPGATDSFLVIDHNSNYGVIVSNHFGCQTAVSGGCLMCGINVHSLSYISVSPNPAINQLIIHASENIDDAMISIINVLGQISIPLLQRGQEEGAMDVSCLKPGIYFLRLQTKEDVFVQRFVKE